MATPCANCANDAVYLLDDPTASPVFFCAVHLPVNQHHRVANGEFKLPDQANPVAAVAATDPGAVADQAASKAAAAKAK